MAIDISNHMSYLDPNNEMEKEKGTPTKCHFTALPKCSWNDTKSELTLGPGLLQICILQPHIQTTTASHKNSLDMKISDTIQKHYHVDATVQDVLIRRFVLFSNSPNLYIFLAVNSTVCSIDAISLYYLHILSYRINIQTHFLLYPCYRYTDILMERHKFVDESESRLQDMIKMFKEEELLSPTTSLAHHSDTKKYYRKKRKQEKRNSMTKTHPTKSRCLERICLVGTCLR